MEIKEMITLIKQEKTLKEVTLKNRKQNINSSYMLAKHDFRCIENIEDAIETYNEIIDDLEELQNRVVARNRLPLI